MEKILKSTKSYVEKYGIELIFCNSPRSILINSDVIITTYTIHSAKVYRVPRFATLC